jgi:hypothetical protein
MRPGFNAMLFAVSFPAHAQEGHLGSGHDKWHQSFYNMLQRPDGKGSCCNLTDCRPTSGRTVDGHYEVKVNGGLDFRAANQNYTSIRAGRWLSRLRTIQLQGSAGRTVLRCVGTGGLVP